MPLDAADKAMICSAGQASPWFVLMLISSKIFTFGFIFLKTLVDLRFMPNDVHEARKWSCGTALWLSLQVYNVDIKPGLIPKVLSILQIYYLPHTSFFCMYPLCCPLPLCIHGNSCLLGSTTGNQQCLNRLGFDHHCGEHTSISVVCWPMRVRIQFGLNPCGTGVRVLKWGRHPSWLLLAESQYSAVVLIFLSATLCILTVFDYYLYGIWNHIDTSQHGNIL